MGQSEVLEGPVGVATFPRSAPGLDISDAMYNNGVDYLAIGSLANLILFRVE